MDREKVAHNLLSLSYLIFPDQVISIKSGFICVDGAKLIKFDNYISKFRDLRDFSYYGMDAEAEATTELFNYIEDELGVMRATWDSIDDQIQNGSAWITKKEVEKLYDGS